MAGEQTTNSVGHLGMVDARAIRLAQLEALSSGLPYLARVVIESNDMANRSAAQWHGSDFSRTKTKAPAPAGYHSLRWLAGFR